MHDFEACGVNGTFPCISRFDRFYRACADERGRFYQANIECIMGKAWAEGDRDGEFAYNPFQMGQQWQEVAAIQARLENTRF